MKTREDGQAVFAQTPGERLALLMHRRGVTVGELATAVGVHRNTISNIVNDRLRDAPKPETIRGIADALGVRPEDVWPTPTPEANGDDDGVREKADKMKPTGTDDRLDRDTEGG